MGEVIHLSRDQAAGMTTFRELIKFYSKKGSKYEEAIEKNKARYRFMLDEVLATKEETSEEVVAA